MAATHTVSKRKTQEKAENKKAAVAQQLMLNTNILYLHHNGCDQRQWPKQFNVSFLFLLFCVFCRLCFTGVMNDEDEWRRKIYHENDGDDDVRRTWSRRLNTVT